ncbi:sigma-70 family RNA polymerase sigma factor [Chitinophaga agrisoli]|uniref:Sigma-70 family RNA polymerase sigma factor n=1 Tax=Chitinophaga agrisoli TaxID=2607653 RepID=A0A5B2VJ76_9BACT|nr:sigma-70 family RNA polymerase sigma factor [Chitinophaga agrisoli]KAA2238964.1 sigma-70 family RNA polymerase sigma factor [Chitinophaga agrisoli]
MEGNELIPNLFRTEYRKIAAVLCKHFGFVHMEIAEDIVSDTFLTATETWGLKGLPENPVAWLYTVAKNKAKNLLKHEAVHQKTAKLLITPEQEIPDTDIDLSDENIRDSQLQMMFAVCHPSIPAESQIGLALRILCGFGIEEIADAFLTNKETINKRLFRAKEKLREENIAIAFPGKAEINKRLEMVLRTLYLLFNEGYYSASQNTVLRKDLCMEAMRLTILLLENPSTNLPPVNALLSLMCFQSSRFEARTDASGETVLYNDQDTSLWDHQLIMQGEYYLNMASQGNELSKYHLEAGIAYWHTIKEDTTEKWEQILQLYNHLLQLEYSPMAALNRTFALSKANGKAEAIVEAEKLQLDNHHLYYSLLGELYTGVDNNKARQHFEKALQMAKSTADQKIITQKIQALG